MYFYCVPAGLRPHRASQILVLAFRYVLHEAIGWFFGRVYQSSHSFLSSTNTEYRANKYYWYQCNCIGTSFTSESYVLCSYQDLILSTRLQYLYLIHGSSVQQRVTAPPVFGGGTAAESMNSLLLCCRRQFPSSGRSSCPCVCVCVAGGRVIFSSLLCPLNASPPFFPAAPQATSPIGCWNFEIIGYKRACSG